MGEATRDPEEIEERIADILGYCRDDGELHDPSKFVEKYAGMRWKCPDCDTAVGKTAYQRASDLRWVLSPGSYASDGSDAASKERDKDIDTGTDAEETSLLDNVQRVQDSILGEEDSSLQEQVESLSMGSDGSEDEK